MSYSYISIYFIDEMQIIINFAIADRIAEARSWAMWVGSVVIGLPFGLPRHNGKRLLDALS